MRYPSTNITLSPPESLPPYTAPMNATDDFISHGLEQARYALLNVRNLTDMVRAPVTLRRGVAQRAASRLNVLEVIVRRLVLLLALGLRLAPVRPRFPTSTAPLPHGVEDVTHTYPALPAPHRLALAGRAVPVWGDDPFGPLSGCARDCGPVPAAPLFARSLDRLKRKGEATPACLLTGSAFRLRPELGLIARALSGMVTAALGTWPGPGEGNDTS